MRTLIVFLFAFLLAGCQLKGASAASPKSGLGALAPDTKKLVFSDLDKAFSSVKRDDALDPLVAQNLGGKWRILDAPVIGTRQYGSGDAAKPCIVVGKDQYSPITYYFICDPRSQEAVDNIAIGNTYDFEGAGAEVRFHEQVSNGVFQNVVLLKAGRCAPSP